MYPALTASSTRKACRATPYNRAVTSPVHGVEHYENFPVASWLMPARLRPAVVAIYRFARHADDVADEGDAPAAERLAALRALREDLVRARAGQPVQAPVVAHNLLALRGQAKGEASYDGYGSCPLTVERGKIVLAEFTYGGKLAPSVPKWLIAGTRPSALAWYLKERVLPPLYWDAMLKGREWLAKPEMVG